MKHQNKKELAGAIGVNSEALLADKELHSLGAAACGAYFTLEKNKTE